MVDDAQAPPLTTVSGWGMAHHARTRLLRPRSIDELKEALRIARTQGWPIALRGAGCSYGDAALQAEGLVLDCSHLNRILAFDSQTGVLEAEPGVTIEQIWRHSLPLGYWPPVVPGTMFPTLGGCAAMNIHGKNNFAAGTIGQHIQSFELLLANGETLVASPAKNCDVFYAAIGGFGMLGVFTRISLRLKKVPSGDLMVEAIKCPNLAAMVATLETERTKSDYLVGWVDAIGGGRGLIHRANYRADPSLEATFRPSHQDLPKRFFGVVPKSWLWLGLWCFLHRPGMRIVNALKYWAGARAAKKPAHPQALVAFSFLLDYVPGWKRAYRPGGLVQYQSFVPKAAAESVFTELLRLSREAGISPFLGVMKRHRPDPFLLTHAIDGYSLALDFPVRPGTRSRLAALARAMDEVVLSAGGKFYFAKDGLLGPTAPPRFLAEESLRKFGELKARLDPEGRFSTMLSQRLFPAGFAGAASSPVPHPV